MASLSHTLVVGAYELLKRGAVASLSSPDQRRLFQLPTRLLGQWRGSTLPVQLGYLDGANRKTYRLLKFQVDPFGCGVHAQDLETAGPVRPWRFGSRLVSRAARFPTLRSIAVIDPRFHFARAGRRVCLLFARKLGPAEDAFAQFDFRLLSRHLDDAARNRVPALRSAMYSSIEVGISCLIPRRMRRRSLSASRTCAFMVSPIFSASLGWFRRFSWLMSPIWTMPLDVVAQVDEGSEFGQAGDFAFGHAADGIFLQRVFPRIAERLLQAKRDALVSWVNT